MDELAVVARPGQDCMGAPQTAEGAKERGCNRLFARTALTLANPHPNPNPNLPRRVPPPSLGCSRLGREAGV